MLSFCTIKPAVNQVELHPYLQQWEVKKICDDAGIYLEAFYPLGGAVNTRSSSKSGAMDDPVIKAIAEKYARADPDSLGCPARYDLHPQVLSAGAYSGELQHLRL